MTSKTIAVLLASVIVVGMVAAFVLIPSPSDDNDDEPEPRDSINIVTLGASNTNGYGMRGYITEDERTLLLNGLATKNDINVYGYQRLPEGAYPDLLRDHYVGVYGEEKVKIDQLAISSMRVEELRILLDDSYYGDDYSSWRFIGPGKWFDAAEDGGLDALRDTYQTSVTNADLITVDIGWNNFGVYVSNQIVDYMSKGQYMWPIDMSDIFDTDTELAAAQECKGIIRGYIVENVGEGNMADALTDIFSYSLLGYMHNFDIVIGKIYEMNPDADVVVLGIQNLLYGLVVEIGDQTIPLGDIFGNFVNMANYYTSACSPYQDQYQYVKAGTNEHVTLFLDYMKDYAGDVDGLDQNVKDCYDYYDDNLCIQPTVDVLAAQIINESPFAPLFTNLGYDDASKFIAAGKNDELGRILQPIFDQIYWSALDAAYDTLSQLVAYVANMPTVKADGLLAGTLNIGQEESQLKDALMDELMENLMDAALGKDYTVDIDKILPDDDAKIVASMYIRFYMGNSFFAHPNGAGHLEIMTAVIGVLEDPSTEKDQEVPDYLADSVREMKQHFDDATAATP